MKKEIIAEAVNAGLTQREIAKKLNLSQTSIRHWLKKFDLKTKLAKQYYENCVECGKQKNTNSKFCSNECKCKNHYWNNKKEHNANTYNRQKRVSKEKKLELIKIFGSKCSICGYNKNYSSLVFHHKDGKSKKFHLDARSLANRKFEVILAEAKKCILLCHNCHNELHNPSCIL